MFYDAETFLGTQEDWDRGLKIINLMTFGLIVTATVLYQVSKLQKLFYRAIDAPEVALQKY
jgi:hypothetical protein